MNEPEELPEVIHDRAQAKAHKITEMLKQHFKPLSQVESDQLYDEATQRATVAFRASHGGKTWDELRYEGFKAIIANNSQPPAWWTGENNFHEAWQKRKRAEPNYFTAIWPENDLFNQLNSLEQALATFEVKDIWRLSLDYDVQYLKELASICTKKRYYHRQLHVHDLNVRHYLESALKGEGDRKPPFVYKEKDSKNTPREVLEMLELPAMLRENSAVGVPMCVGISVNRPTESLVRHLAGKTHSKRVSSKSLKSSNITISPPNIEVFKDRNAEVFLPDDETLSKVLERIAGDKNELKAKAFVSLLALAEGQENPSEFIVDLKDLLALHGYSWETTNSKNYWSRAGELIRYYMMDLPNIQIALQMFLYGEKEPRYLHEYLTHRARLITEQQTIFPESNFIRQFYQIVRGDDEAVVKSQLGEFFKDLRPKGLKLGIPKDIFTGFGLTKGQGERNAVERVPKEMLALKGCSFWLAYDVAFTRRWSKPSDDGKPMLDVLEKCGYLEKAHKRNRSFKEAIEDLANDSLELAKIGLLEVNENTAIRFFKGGKDVSQEVRTILQTEGHYLNEDYMNDLNVAYSIPSERLKELETVRAKHELLASKSRKRRKKDGS